MGAQCSDGKWIAIGSIEPQFYAELLKRANITDPAFHDQYDAGNWPDLRTRLQDHFRTRSRQEWCRLMEGTDVCFAPVMSLSEAPDHPHNVARGTFHDRDGILQPGPAPRFSRTRPEIQRPPPAPGEHTEEILRDWGVRVG